MASVDDVAAAILDCTGPLDTLKLEKLIYYTQAWAAAWHDEALFDERIEAWADGPVVRELFNRHKRLHFVSLRSFPGADAHRLPAWGRTVVRFVCGYYGHMTGAELRDRTHSEKPWTEARRREGLRDGQPGTAEIPVDALRDFYRTQEPHDQRWYWNEEWQKGEAEAAADVENGRTAVYKSDEDFLASFG